MTPKSDIKLWTRLEAELALTGFPASMRWADTHHLMLAIVIPVADGEIWITDGWLYLNWTTTWTGWDVIWHGTGGGGFDARRKRRTITDASIAVDMLVQEHPL